MPPGFTTFEIVEPIKEPFLDEAGSLTYRLREHHLGVGHTAHLPDGGRLTLTPGDRDTYTAAGYYLAAYDAHDDRLWGRRFDNVHAALTHARSHLREAELPSAATRIPYVGEGADGLRRSAQIDREEADTFGAGDPRLGYPTTRRTHGGLKPSGSHGPRRRPRAGRAAARQNDGWEVFTTGHDQDRTDNGDRGQAPRAAVSHVPRVDWVHDADLRRILGGEPEPDSLPDPD